MARVFITGSADGLGLAVGQRLIDQGHEVVLHARSEARADDTRRAAPGAADVVVGDLSVEAEVRALAEAADAAGPYDAIVHNAAVGSQSRRQETPDGRELSFAVNVVAPYLLTALMAKPRRLVYLSSGAHRNGVGTLEDVQWADRPWNGGGVYGSSKLLDAALALGVARRWPGVASNAVDPGWIRTRMGGSHAPGDLDAGSATQIWLAVGDDTARTTGGYFLNRREDRLEAVAADPAFQDALLALLERETGTPLPA